VNTLARSDCGIAAVIVYSWVTPEHDPGYLEDWYGIHQPPPQDGSWADTDAFASAVHAASAAGPPLTVCAPRARNRD